MLNRRALLLLCALLPAICGGGALPTQAQTTPMSTEAAAFIDTVGRRALAIVGAKKLSKSESISRFRALLLDSVDLPFIAHFTLGRYWKIATPKEQQEFQVLLESMVVGMYADNFRSYSGETFQLKSHRQETDRDAVIVTDIMRPNGPPMTLEWRVRKSGAGYKIIDVIVERVSMALSQRDEYNAFIQSNGEKIEPLLKSLREKAANLIKE
ncbi:phospholipid transport system substrate-binding protein [Azospirillaceae bacterium]